MSYQHVRQAIPTIFSPGLQQLRFQRAAVGILFVVGFARVLPDFSHPMADFSHPMAAIAPHVVERKMRFDWAHLDPQSELAKRIRGLQDDCTLPVKDYYWRDSCCGLGSDLHVWSAFLSFTMMTSNRMRAPRPWIHADRDACGEDASFLCYFPAAESNCEHETVDGNVTGQDWGVPMGSTFTASEFRAASAEFLFSPVSEILVQEAERQLQAVFGDKGVPSDLITVHLRWGDKHSEAPRVSIDEYVAAIEKIVKAPKLNR